MYEIRTVVDFRCGHVPLVTVLAFCARNPAAALQLGFGKDQALSAGSGYSVTKRRTINRPPSISLLKGTQNLRRNGKRIPGICVVINKDKAEFDKESVK